MTVPPAELARFRSLVAERLGLHLEPQEPAARVLAERAGTAGVAAYLDRLATDPTWAAEEHRALARELTCGETFFYRHREQLEAFAMVALPDRLAARGGIARVLSAGCASGEEPYTLAVLARELLGDGAGDVVIEAFDVNADALQRAARALYSPWSVRDVPEDVRRRWFAASGTQLALHPAVQAAVRFSERNLVDEACWTWAPGTLDVVFCRNALMYLEPDRARVVVERIARCLAPGGYLFLGYAESLRGLSNDFEVVNGAGAYFYRRRPPEAICPPSADDARTRPDRSALAPRRPPPPEPSTREAREALEVVRELVMHQRFAEALERLEAIPVARRAADHPLLRAALLADAGRIAEAEAACREMIAAGTWPAGARYLLGLCRDAAGDAAGAIDHQRAALRADPGFAMARLHLGRLLRRAGDLDGARRELGLAAQLLPRETPDRVLLFGGGFPRDGLVTLCRAELAACGGEA